MWFGGKSRVANIVWQRFGDVDNFCEPFFGSGAVLLGRPTIPKTETVNDRDCLIANVWRAIKDDPAKVAYYADWPVNEADLLARHRWLVTRKAWRKRIKTDPEFYDAHIAGWWLWGMAIWIGGGWCTKSIALASKRKRPELGADKGVLRKGIDIPAYIQALSDRLRHVRVCCSDWSAVCQPTPTIYQPGISGIFLDPPYAKEAKRSDGIYRVDDTSVAHAVRKWAIEWGEHKKMRIALCGYEGEHQMPDTWKCVHWKTAGGYANRHQARGFENVNKERIWFSPYCLEGGFRDWLDG